MRDQTLFESFNARFLDPVQVGSGFIYTPVFREIAKRQHSVLLGPRGSGKTTFLKMLTLPALWSWRSRHKKEIAGHIDYITVYVPSDFAWYPEFRLPIDVKLESRVDNILTSALFRAHVLLSICDTLGHLQNPDLTRDPFIQTFIPTGGQEQWTEVAAKLAGAWQVKNIFGGVPGLRLGIEDRIRAIQRVMVRTAIAPVRVEDLVAEHEFLLGFFFDDIRSLADIMAAAFEKQFSWCICFDEVEIAPLHVRRQIMQSARSFDQRVLLKISSSPFDEVEIGAASAEDAMAGHDFNQINLTQGHHHDVQRFSTLMFEALCREVGIRTTSPLKILGTSFFDDRHEDTAQPDGKPGADAKEAPPYSRLGFYYRKFSSLAAKDPSFEDYLTDRKIDLLAMDSLSEKVRAADVRKIISSVVIRDEFLFSQDEESAARGKKVRKIRARKKVPEIYTGARAIFAICEGNPRWLIGLIRPLLEAYKEGQITSHSNIVHRAEQARRIEATLTQFLSLLSTIRASRSPSPPSTVIQCLDVIGSYFEEQFLSSKFNPDPIGTFIIDDRVDDEVVGLVGRALNQGAFVIIPGKNRSFRRGSIRGERLRLSHLLSPMYKIPLVTGRPIALSTILKGQNTEVAPNLLTDLFGRLQ